MPVYEITEASYIGRPRSGTVMFLVKKVERMLEKLNEVENCLIYIEDTIEIPEKLEKKHRFIKSNNPKKGYSLFVADIYKRQKEYEKKRKYTLNGGGYYVGENVKVGKNVHIGPGSVIGHDVIIGDDSEIYANSSIHNAIIGNDFILREGAVIGCDGFTLAKDDNNKWIRTPSIGKVVIGNHVEIGANTTVARGTADSTYIDDYVKIDALVYIGHDARIMNNTEVAAGGIIGGYVETGEDVMFGFNATIRNRIEIEDGALIGMGAVAVKSVGHGVVVIGNPAKPFA